MSPSQRKEAARYLKAFDFSGLFTDPSIGWDWPESGQPLKVPTSHGFRELQVIAEKKGVKILLVPPLADGSIMPSDERKKLEVAVTPLAAEHLLIFADQAKTRQVWLWTSRLPGKPIRRRELNWEKGPLQRTAAAKGDLHRLYARRGGSPRHHRRRPPPA